jgi:hypothetical protein
MQALVVTITACLSVAVVFGTDVFFTVVGRTALARASDSAVLEVMAHLHAVADRRMPAFGVTGLAGTGLLLAFEPHARALAAVSLVAQLLFLALYASFAKPINVRMMTALRAGTEPHEARALQVRWESILIYRSLLLGTALSALLLALTKEG